MSVRRVVVILAAPCLLGLGVQQVLVRGVQAQSLAETAEKTKKERDERKGQGGKTYSDEDLKRVSPNRDDKAKGAKGKASPSPSPARVRETPATQPGQEANWRSRAAEARRVIAAAETKLAALKAETNRTGGDALMSTDTNEILRLRERQEALRTELEAAEKQLLAAKEQFTKLEDEARRASVPPGWLRE